MATFATNPSEAERGPTRSNTFETLVAETESLKASSSSTPADNNSSPDGDNAASSNNTTESLKVPDWDRVSEFEDVNRLPKGFPRFVTQQTRVHNGSIQRRFERPGELLLCYTHYEVIFAEQRIYEYFLEHPDVCKRLTAGQRREPGKRCELEEIDALYEALERAYLRHHTLLIAQKEKQSLLGVHREEVHGVYSFLASQDIIDADVYLPAYATDSDFCTTARNQGHLPIRDLLYTRAGRWLPKKLPLFKFSEDSGGFLLSMTALTRVLEVFQVFFSSGLLLVPTSILLFGGLDRRAMFGVVVGFVFLFSTAVVLGRGIGGMGGDSGGFAHGNGLLLGLVAAYTAVLATFLLQLGA